MTWEERWRRKEILAKLSPSLARPSQNRTLSILMAAIHTKLSKAIGKTFRGCSIKNTLVVFHDYGIEEGVTKVVDRIDRRRYKVTIWRIAIVKLKRH